MSIFRRETAEPPRPPAGPTSNAAPASRMTQIAPGTRIKGEVTGSAELLIDGELEGEVRVDTAVIVGPGGVMRGPVAARVVRVAGKVFGDVRGGERVEVAASGSVEGDIVAPRVVIAEGAFFKGKVEMQSDKARQEPRRASNGPGRGD